MWWCLLFGCPQAPVEPSPIEVVALPPNDHQQERQGLLDSLADHQERVEAVPDVPATPKGPQSALPRVLLHRDDAGAFDGLRLSKVAGTGFARMGLQEDDIVHSIDGLPLASMSQAMEAYNVLSNRSGKAEVKITRNGKPSSVMIDLDELKSMEKLLRP